MHLDQRYSLMGLFQLTERYVIECELINDLIEFVNKDEVSSKIFGGILIRIVNEGKSDDIF